MKENKNPNMIQKQRVFLVKLDEITPMNKREIASGTEK